MPKPFGKVVVSLTTIPSRAGYLAAVVDSLRAQTTPPDAIELNLPRAYRRAELGTVDRTVLPEGIDIHEIDHDFGPASKVLPTCTRYQGTDTLIVYCDDDMRYDPDWLTRLTTAAAEHPNAVIAERGSASLRLERHAKWHAKGPRYTAGRIASLGLWNPLRWRGYRIDIVKGYAGVAIRPHFLDATAYDIPKIIWAHDDLWLSGMYEKNGHPVVLSDPKKSASTASISTEGEAAAPRVNELDSLAAYSLDGYDRAGMNTYGIRYMRETFGVFDKGRRVA